MTSSLPAEVSPTLGGSDGLAGGRRRAAYLTAAVGLAHGVLFLVAYWLLASGPDPRATDAEIIEFYESGDQRQLILVGLYIMPFAGIAFIWFTVALRMWIATTPRRVDALFSNVQLVCGIIFVGLFFAAGAASASTAASLEFSESPVDPVVARQLPQFGTTILLVFAMRMAAMFVFTTSRIARSVGVLPGWFIYTGYGVGAFLLLSATFTGVLVLVFPAWIFVLCVLLMRRVSHMPVDAELATTQLQP